MNSDADLLGQRFEDTPVRPLEPLYSMLAVMPEKSLIYTLETLQDFDDESALDDRYENVGLSRRDYIRQVFLVMRHRGMR